MVEIGVVRARDNEKLLVVALQLIKGIFAEIPRMGLLAVNKENGASDFARVREERHRHEGERRGHVPGAVGVDGASMEASRRLVVLPIVLHELRFVALQFLRETGSRRIGSGGIVLRALCIRAKRSGHPHP